MIKKKIRKPRDLKRKYNGKGYPSLGVVICSNTIEIFAGFRGLLFLDLKEAKRLAKFLDQYIKWREQK